MSIYNHLINILYTTSSIYIFITFFKINPKYNKKLILTVVIIFNVLLTILTNSDLNSFLYSIIIVISDLLLFYFFFKGSCINNLIKINLICVLLGIVNFSTDLITTFFYHIITGHSANLYATNVATKFELFTFTLSMIVWILLIKIIDSQFASWVMNLSGLTQNLILFIVIFIPLFYMPIMGLFLENISPENLNVTLLLAVSFLFFILLSILALALFQRRQEIKKIKAKVHYQNEQYQKLLALQLHMRILKHDLNNFLETNNPEFQSEIIKYCDEIEMDLEELQ